MSWRTILRIGLGVATCGLATGCNVDPVYFTDDVDLSFDFIQQLLPMFPGADMTHGPYVVGSSFRVFVNTQRSTQSMAAWSCESSDPSVFTVNAVSFNRGESADTDWLAVDVTMVGDGEADLVVLDGDRVVDTTIIDARVPDSAELHAAAPLFVDTGGLVPTRSDSPQILTGGQATYEVRWFQGGEPIHGHGALSVDAGGEVEVTTEQTWFFESRDWIHVFPLNDGPATFTLRSYGFDVQDVTIHGVSAESVAQIDVFGGQENGAEEGAWLGLMAQATDARGEPIHGVDFAWDRDGVEEYGVGDLYRYEFAPLEEVPMKARFGDVASDEVVIHAAGGYVDSSNYVGCDSSTVGPTALLGLVGLALARRRR